MSDWPQKFLHAFSELHHYESISAAHDTLSLDDAYDVQHQFVALRSDRISGYKAALTAEPAQQAMGIHTPIMGVLFESGDFPANEPIKPNKQALLETELGFRVAEDIGAEVSEQNVHEFIECCLPMIEVASPNLATKPNGIDLVATNAASYGYVTGAAHSVDATDLDELTVSLAREGETLQSGQGGEVLGGQRRALTWLINETLARGYRISRGHLLMTGSIGGIQPATPAHYSADFGPLGTLEFDIAP